MSHNSTRKNLACVNKDLCATTKTQHSQKLNKYILKNEMYLLKEKEELVKQTLTPTHVKKQRHYFADRGPYSQGYGFSSSHV